MIANPRPDSARVPLLREPARAAVLGAALADVGDLDAAGGPVDGRRDRVGGRGLPRVQHDVGARLGGREQDVGDGVLIDADPAQRVTENLAHDGNAQQFPFEHQAESDLRPSHSPPGSGHRAGSLPREMTAFSQDARFPATRRRNQTHRFVSDGSVGGMQREFLDHRVGEQFAGQFLDRRQRGAVGRPVDLKLEALSLAHAGHVAEAEAM